MTRIILSGCNGKMGKTITACVADRSDCEIVAGFDINTESATYPVFADPATCTVKADVIVDFSHPAMLDRVLAYAQSHSLPIVIATTGLSDDQLQSIQNATAHIALFSSANMSLGISLLAELAKKAASVLGTSFDVEIIEKHHNQKIDAPSGTALMLADAVKDGLPYTPSYVYDRHAVRQKRDKQEIGFSSIRGGTIVGEHDILFAGHDECITLSHTAASKGVFATGAINAALFLVGKPAGYYTMKDLVSLA
ncbi:MAG: 4-hydroxy-tetrahydrodipicolinate reductase [Clostridia bacterium]|nr:4-hydroxy-tetrahydrodipicolinate reductase [Clostridia bacterium]